MNLFEHLTHAFYLGDDNFGEKVIKLLEVYYDKDLGYHMARLKLSEGTTEVSIHLSPDGQTIRLFSGKWLPMEIPVTDEIRKQMREAQK